MSLLWWLLLAQGVDTWSKLSQSETSSGFFETEIGSFLLFLWYEMEEDTSFEMGAA